MHKTITKKRNNHSSKEKKRNIDLDVVSVILGLGFIILAISLYGPISCESIDTLSVCSTTVPWQNLFGILGLASMYYLILLNMYGVIKHGDRESKDNKVHR